MLMVYLRRIRPKLVTRDFWEAAKAALYHGVLGAVDVVNSVGNVVSTVGDGVADVGNGVGTVTGDIRTHINDNMPTASQIASN